MKYMLLHNIFYGRMFNRPVRTGVLVMFLILCLQDGLSVIPVDTVKVFYKDKAFNGFLNKAIRYQQKADSLNELSIEWRKEIMRMDDPAERTALQRRITKAEDSTVIYREMARVHFAYMNGRLPDEKKVNPWLVEDTVLDGITVYEYRLSDDFLARLNEKTDALSVAGNPELARSGSGSNFKIYDRSPYSEALTFEYDFPLPSGVFYRIQLAVYKTRLAPDHFKGLSPITTEKIPAKNLIRFFVGKFYHYKDAREALEKVRAYGHTDAFIIGYYNGTKGTFQKLQELERQP